jgi:hypothetical protein
MANLPISELPLVPSGSPESLMVIVDYSTESSGVTSSIYYSSVTNNILSKSYASYSSNEIQTITGSTTNEYVVKTELPIYENGITIVDDSKYYVSKTGTYVFDFSLQIQKSGTSVSQLSIWNKVNGENVIDSAGDVAITGSLLQSRQIVGWSTLLELNEGDFVELYWSSDNQLPSLFHVDTRTSPIRPSSPSVAVTITQIS